MKKYYKLTRFLLVLFLCFAITGCFGNKQEKEQTTINTITTIKEENPSTNITKTTTTITTITKNQNQSNIEYSEEELYKGYYIACKGNLKNIGTACELYAIDHEGIYPISIDLIEKEGIMTLPICRAEHDHYEFESSENPHFYSVKCPYHKISFDSKIGLTEPNPIEEITTPNK